MEYISLGKMEEDVICQYENLVPPLLVDLWKNQGIGTLLGGYFKVINPDEYEELLKES